MVELRKGHTLEIGQRVEIYRNLRKDCYSIRDKKTKRVIAYCTSFLLDDCVFVVQQGGRERAVQEGRRNVHAWVEGNFRTSAGILIISPNRVRYSPFESAQFITEDGRPIDRAKRVCGTKDYKIYATTY